MKAIKFPVWVILLIVLVWLVSACQSVVSAPTATQELPNRILFIGDSLTYWNLGVDTHMEPLAASANPPVTIDASSVTKPALDLKKLWSIPQPREAIQEGSWDVVVLQEDLAMSGYDEQEFYEYTRKFYDEIKGIDAQTVLYMTWEFNENRGVSTIEDIARAYSTIGSELGVKVAPVGLAWKRSIQERPDLNLYDIDEMHPSMRGTYLTICVLYATIFGQSPVGLSYQPAEDSYSGEQLPMSEEEVAFLQRIAWETVQEFQAQK
jgi:hypothetical protein